MNLECQIDFPRRNINIRLEKKVNFLYGKNGSGKSTLLQTLSAQQGLDAHYVPPEKGGVFQYASNITEQELRTPRERINQRRRNQVNDYRRRIFSLIDEYLRLRGGKPETDRSTYFQSLEKYITELLPEYEIKLTTSPMPEFTINKNGIEVPGDKLSSGEINTITQFVDAYFRCLVWNLDESIETGLLLIDEPAGYMHSDLERRFYHSLKSLTDEFEVKILLATNSEMVVGEASLLNSDLFILSLDEDNPIKSIDASSYKNTIGQYFGGIAFAGRITGYKLLLVEGEDDWMIWSTAARAQTGPKIVVAPCNGSEIDEVRRKLELIFDASMDHEELVGFALKDNDSKQPNLGRQNNDTYVDTYYLDCHEIENIYLAEEFWTNEEIEEIEDLESDRRWGEAKEIISQVEEIKSGSLDWRQVVGKHLGKGRPEGEVAEWLGNELIEFIYE